MATNLKQQQFIEHYLRLKNATQAAKLAGYSPKTAASAGSRLLKDRDVREEIERIKKLSRSSAVMTLKEAQEILTEIARGKMQTYLNSDGSINVIAVVNGGRDVVEYTEITTAEETRRKIKLHDQKAAIKELGDICNWQKSPAQKLNFNFNLDGKETDTKKDK